MFQQIKSEVVKPVQDRAAMETELPGYGFFSGDRLLSVRPDSVESLYADSFAIHDAALALVAATNRLHGFLIEIENDPLIRSFQETLLSSGHRVLVAAVQKGVFTAWRDATHSLLELTSEGFRVRDARWIERNGVIEREYLERKHILEIFARGFHIRPADLKDFANAGVTVEAVWFNLSVQLADQLPSQIWESIFRKDTSKS